jgi:hypothetical protein
MKRRKKNRHLPTAGGHRKSSRTPPGIDEGKPWPFRVVEWQTFDGRSGTVMVPVGMEVQESLHGRYWESVKIFEDSFAVWEKRGEPCPRVFVLMDKDNQVVGVGPMMPTDGPAELAWLDCMFIEMRHWRIGLRVPADIDVSKKCRRGNVFEVTEKEGA